jgi:hypothetical protein
MSTPDQTQHAGTAMRAPALWCLAAAVLFGASTPVAKALLSWLWLGEPIQPTQCLAAGLMTAAASSPRSLSALSSPGRTS